MLLEMLMPRTISWWNFKTLSLSPIQLLFTATPFSADLNFLISGDGTVSPYSIIPWGFLVNFNLSSAWIWACNFMSPVVFRGENIPFALLEAPELYVLIEFIEFNEFDELEGEDEDEDEFDGDYSIDSFISLTVLSKFWLSSRDNLCPCPCSRSFPSFDIFIWNKSIHSILFCGSFVKILLSKVFVSFVT